MVWLTWRQHRIEVLGCLLVLAAVGAVLVVLGLPMHHSFNQNGVAGCLAQSSPSQSCSEVIRQFTQRYVNSGAAGLVPWLDFLPAFLGVFLGAPLLAREFEQGTWRLAWTQAVPRTRWLAVKLGLLVVAVAVLTAALAALFTWYRGPVDQVQGRLVNQAFDFEGLAIPAYALFAFALGTLAGVLTRRTVIAMVATLGGFLAVRLPIEFWLRPHYQHPLTVISNSHDTPRPTDLQLSSQLVDHSGHILTDAEQTHVIETAVQSQSGKAVISPAANPIDNWLRTHGYHWRTVFQPTTRFWHFQLIEAAIFIGLAAILLTSAVWLVRRRVG